MLQGDAASPIRPPCSDSSRLTEETRGVRNHPDPVNGASGPAPSNAPQPSTAAASSCAATGARRLKALRAHEDTWRKRLPTVRAGVRRTSRATAGRAPALVPCYRACCILDAELSDVIVFAAPLSAPAAARARAPPLLRSNTLNFMALQIRVGA